MPIFADETAIYEYLRANHNKISMGNGQNNRGKRDAASCDARRASWLWAGSVWAAFASLLWMLRVGCGFDAAAELLWFVPLTAGEAALLTVPLLWLRRRYWWSLWTALAILSVFVLVNAVYCRRFGNLMPYTTMFRWENINGMVLSASIDTLRLVDLMYAVPLLALGIAWYWYFSERVSDMVYRCRVRRWLSLGAFVLWLVGEVLGAVRYYCDFMQREQTELPRPLACIARKAVGEGMLRDSYLRYNGLLCYALWNLRDFSPGHELSEEEKARVEAFVAAQQKIDAASPLPPDIPAASVRRPNFLLIMVESLESWAIDLRVNGRSAMPRLDSLIHNAPGTLYWSDIEAQISVGVSSDGHLMDICGLLPLRNYSVAQDFGANVFPSIFHAFKDLGYHTFEISCDSPSMWRQQTTARSWGFDDYRHDTDMDPGHQSSWATRDYYWAQYVADYVAKARQPWAGMAVTLSLHSPYHTAISGNNEIEDKKLDEQSIHYLKIAASDDRYISQILDTLRMRGTYDNTIVAITGDHMAQGLTAEHRPPSVAAKAMSIPLVILNAPIASRIERGRAGQIDIYPTLLDVCGLGDYRWRGVGLSLLRHGTRGAVNRVGEATGSCTAAERLRQREAWEVSRLILSSDYFAR